MAPLDPFFDDYHLCDTNRCYKNRVEEDMTLPVDGKTDRMKTGYYICKVEDKYLYKTLCEKYEFYTIEENTTQPNHEFDTKLNKEMVTCVSKYAPKTNDDSKSIPLENRVKTAAGINRCGYQFL